MTAVLTHPGAPTRACCADRNPGVIIAAPAAIARPAVTRRPSTAAPLCALHAAALALLVAGCAAPPPPAAPPVPPLEGGARGEWFCDRGSREGGWECIADQPVPGQPAPVLPGVEVNAIEPPPAAVAGGGTGGIERIDGDRGGFAQLPGDAAPVAPRRLDPVTPVAQASGPAPRANPPGPLPGPAAAGAPQRLADLPADWHAVQLIALSSREAVEKFAITRQLPPLTGARIARNGELVYVLILGVHPTRAEAERTVANRPASVRDVEPWIRSVGTLQQAMREADRIAGD